MTAAEIPAPDVGSAPAEQDSRAPAESPGRGQAIFASLRVRNYRLFFWGQSISVAGNWMQNVAIGWLTLQLTHSGAILGLIAASRYAPVLLLGPWGGLVVDRRDKLRLLSLTQILSAVLTGGLAVLAWVGHASVPVLFAIVLSLGLVNVLDGPGRQSLISNLVPRDLLANAIALNSVAMNTSRVLGPAAAGVLISGLGVTLCFVANAVSFLLVVVLLYLMRRSEFIAGEPASRAQGQIRAAFSRVWNTPGLLFPLLLVAVSGTFAWEFPVSLPLLTANSFGQGPQAYGGALASLGAGCVIGGFIAARRSPPTPGRLSRTAIWWGVSLGLTSASPTLLTAYLLLVPVGVFAVTFNSSAKTVLQLTAPAEMRGRVMALWSMAWQGSTVAGAPIIGTVGQHWGARASLWLGGLLCGVAGIAVLVHLRRHGPEGG